MVHIAIPEPTSPDHVEDSAAYNLRSLPQYLHALISAGATPIVIPLHESPQRVAKILSTCHGILLPGSPADIDPQKYGAAPNPLSAPPDPLRAAVDELLIQDAFNLHKPILAVCQGLQGLNTWCGGTLFQDVPTEIGASVGHAPGRTVHEAHPVDITPGTRLASLVPPPEIDDLVPKFADGHAQRSAAGHGTPVERKVMVNSSHHQAVQTPGDNLTVAARSPQDGVIEALELASSGPHAHWVVAVQWHPERTTDSSAFSRNIFHAFVEAAESWTPRKIEESVLQA